MRSILRNGALAQLIALAVALVPGWGGAAEAYATPPTPDAAETELPALAVYRQPTLIKAPELRYPDAQRRQYLEGWVQLHFMVDTSGTAYDIKVVDSTGVTAFEREAERALSQARFEPAMLGDRPVDGASRIKMSFELTGTGGATLPFTDHYRRFGGAIEKRDRARADTILAAMRVRNLYEDAYFALAQFQYHQLWGSQAQQLSALERAIAFEKEPRYLSPDVFARVYQQLFYLRLASNQLAAALDAWEVLERLELPESAAARIRAAVAELESIRSSDRPFALEAQLDDRRQWTTGLLKTRFRLVAEAGTITSISLRCDRQVVDIRYAPDLEYTVDVRDGACELWVHGEPGTRFRLIQS